MRIKFTLPFFLIIFSLFTVFFLVHAFAQTQPGLDVTISPSVVELVAKPGDKISGRFRLHNNLSTPLTFDITVDKLNGDSITGMVTPIKAAPGDTSPSWVQFDQPHFTARPNEWTNISYSITIPKDAAFGYYYAVRIGQKLTNVQRVTAKVQGEVLLPLLLTVDHAGAVRSANLVSFSTTPYVNQYLPINFQTMVKNTGNVLLKPTGNIFIRGTGDKDIAILNVNEGLGAILPGNIRLFKNSWDDGFLVYEPIVENGIAKVDKAGNPLMHLVINWDRITSFRIGKYTANLLLVYDNGTRDVAIEGTTTFWVFPYMIVGGVLLGIIILIVLIRFMLRAYVQAQIRKYKS